MKRGKEGTEEEEREEGTGEMLEFLYVTCQMTS